MFSPTFVDIGIFIGTIGFFFVLFLLYSRTFPVIAQAEVKSILKSSGARFKGLRDDGQALVSNARKRENPKKPLKPKKKSEDKQVSYFVEAPWVPLIKKRILQMT